MSSITLQQTETQLPLSLKTEDVSPTSTPISQALAPLGASSLKFGTLIPNRIFVGGIAANTTEQELKSFFSTYGQVKDAKIINDRTGLSKGSYGFVTFENQEVAEKLIKNESDCLIFKDRKLNIGQAVRKQATFPRTDGPLVVAGGSLPYYPNGIPLFQLAGQEYPVISPQQAAYAQMILPQQLYMPQPSYAYSAPAALQSQTTHSAAAAQSLAAQTFPHWATPASNGSQQTASAVQASLNSSVSANGAQQQWRWPQSPQAATVAPTGAYIYSPVANEQMIYYAPSASNDYPTTNDGNCNSTNLMDSTESETSPVHGHPQYATDACMSPYSQADIFQMSQGQHKFFANGASPILAANKAIYGTQVASGGHQIKLGVHPHYGMARVAPVGALVPQQMNCLPSGQPNQDLDQQQTPVSLSAHH